MTAPERMLERVKSHPTSPRVHTRSADALRASLTGAAAIMASSASPWVAAWMDQSYLELHGTLPTMHSLPLALTCCWMVTASVALSLNSLRDRRRFQPHPAQPHPTQPRPTQPRPTQPYSAATSNELAPACLREWTTQAVPARKRQQQTQDVA